MRVCVIRISLLIFLFPSLCTSQTTVYSLAVDTANTGNVYTSTYLGGVRQYNESITSYLGCNSGLSSVLPTAYYTIFTVEIAPSNYNIVYCGTTHGHVYRSINGGTSWSDTELTARRALLNIAVDPSDTEHVFALVSTGIYEHKSGRGWEFVFPGLGNVFEDIAFDPFDSDIVYTVTSNKDGTGSVYISSDSGANWSETAVFHGLYRMGFDPDTEGTVYVTTYAGVYKTVDNGVNWSLLSSGLPETLVTAIVVDPVDTSIIYAGTREGVYISENSGNTWSNTNIVNDKIKNLAFSKDESILYIGTTMNGLLTYNIPE